MLRALTAVVLCGLVMLGACSGKYIDQSGGDDGGKSAPEQCRDYASTWCNKFFNCYVKVGRLKEADKQRNIDECYRNIDGRLPCAEVTSISSDYDTCLSQVNGMSCTKFDLPKEQLTSVMTPASCSDIMSFE